ncbi:MAG: AAA family ATPase [Candidatus Omnitrophota bacterium]|nr:AAA family ATPase [Candidatus Omnitrophota bacterium]
MAKVISVCNQKGGVGKTTTVVNLGYYLAHKGKNVLIIDLDPQANATSGLGIDKSKIEKSTYDFLINSLKPSEVMLEASLPNLKIIPSNIHLSGAEIELVSFMNREYKLKNALKDAVNEFDFVLIDSPPSLGILTINSLAACNSVLIPIQCEYYALEGLSQLLNTVNLVRENLNKDLEIQGVLLTMADYRTNLTSEVIDEAKRFFKDKVFKTIIPRSIKLSEAPGFGQPIHLYDKHSIGARTYLSLANEILGEPAVLGGEEAWKKEFSVEA